MTGHLRHGDAQRGRQTRLYKKWFTMLRRCYDQNFARYPSYGGRGIKVCPQWRQYEVFKEWALNHDYQDGLTIERIDVNGDYTPDNCTWIPMSQQQRNTRQIRWVTAWGETKPLIAWAEDPRAKMSYGVIRTRLLAGYKPEAAIESGRQKTGPKPEPDKPRSRHRKAVK
jgi:hypothetical protein